MNTMIAKVIAFELGLLIAILTWMAVTDFPKNAPNHAATAAARTERAFATVSPVFRANEPRVEPVDYPAEEEPAGLEDDEPIRTVETYAEDVGAEPYVDSGYNDYAVPADPRNYIGDYPEPVLYEPDCYTTPFFPSVYQQPAHIIIVSNSRAASGRRHRLTSRPPRERFMNGPRQPRREVARPRVHRMSRRPSPPNGAVARRTGAVSPRAGAAPRGAIPGWSTLASQGIRTGRNR
jgi:hypothetical protein